MSKCEKTYDTAKAAADCCGVQVQEVTVEVEKLVYTSSLAAGNYTVYHLQQKTTGEKAFADYVLKSKEINKTVAADSTVANLKKTYTGFTVKAMAQNESVIYIFYDRNTITYTFNTGSEGKFSDGTTSKTVSGLYGTGYSKPINPTRENFSFARWVNGEKSAPLVFGADNMTFTAVWRNGGTPDYSTCEVGDFILKDGSILAKDETPTANTVAAVIFRAKNGDKPALGVGIVHNRSGLIWCKKYTDDTSTTEVDGYNTKITALLGDTVSGYMNGSDSWVKVNADCTDATEHPEYYPAFNYCLTYGIGKGFSEDLVDGWYLPTVAELKTIYDNRENVETSLTKAGGNTFGSSYYWSCCQGYYSVTACMLYFSDGEMHGGSKSYNYYADRYVCSVRAFN